MESAIVSSHWLFPRIHKLGSTGLLCFSFFEQSVGQHIAIDRIVGSPDRENQLLTPIKARSDVRAFFMFFLLSSIQPPLCISVMFGQSDFYQCLSV